MTQPYIDVTQFITDPSVLIPDGDFLYHPNLYGVATPTDSIFGFRFEGNFSAFDVLSKEPINTLDILPESGIKSSHIISNTLIILDNDGKLHFHKYNNNNMGTYYEATYIDSTFSSDIRDENNVYKMIIHNPDFPGAIFITEDDVIHYHLITPFTDLTTLINGRVISDGAVSSFGELCLVFDNGEILYHNGNSNLSDVSYDVLPDALLSDPDYTSYVIGDVTLVSPNGLVNIAEVVSSSGFSVRSFDGNIIVWGGAFQSINLQDGTMVAPEATYDIDVLVGSGNDYGVGIRDGNQVTAWGDDVDNLITNAKLLTDVYRVLPLNSTFLVSHTTDNGKSIEYVSDNFPSTDSFLGGDGTYFNWVDLQERIQYAESISYANTGYAFFFNTKENQSNTPVKVDFKLVLHEGKYLIPIQDYFGYDPAKFTFNVYSRESTKEACDTLGENLKFSIVDTYYNQDGNTDFSKVIVTPLDVDQNGIPDDPLSYRKIVSNDDIIIIETFQDFNNVTSTRVASNVVLISEALFLKPGVVYYADVDRMIVNYDQVEVNYEKGSFYKGDEEVDGEVPNEATLLVDGWDDDTGILYEVKRGRGFSIDNPFNFTWNHYSSDGADRIDPSISSIMDMYVLTSAYDSAARRWLRNGAVPDQFPRSPTSEEVRNSIKFIERNKSTSDQIIYIPAEYRLLFGESARPEHQADFKVIKLKGSTLTDNEIKTEVVNSINEYFDIDNWDFGDRFYFTELASFIHTRLSGHVGSVVIVPRLESSSFGDLFQIKCQPNELFLSTATVDNVVITNQYTNQNLRRFR